MVSITALTVLIGLLQIGCTPVNVLLNSDFGLSLDKKPIDEEPIKPSEIVVASQPSYINSANVNAYTIGGTCENVETIDVKINGVLKSSVSCSSKIWQVTLDSSSESEGPVNIELIDQNTKAPPQTLNIVKDTYPPSIVGTLNDGVVSLAGTTPTLSWNTSYDSGPGSSSGIDYYEIAIGTSPGGVDVMNWTSAGTGTTGKFSSINIHFGVGLNYYASVRAIDRAGNLSSSVAGDGFLVKPVVRANSIVSNNGAFAAILNNGKVICWGDSLFGGDYSNLPSALKIGPLKAIKLASTYNAFAAIMDNGSVIAWGNSSAGGDTSLVAPLLNGSPAVTHIATTKLAFAALRSDGTVVAWGESNYGGFIPSPKVSNLTNVTTLYANTSAFAALRSDGSVIAWGGNSGTSGSGDTSTVDSDINGTIDSLDVVDIYSTSNSFIAKRANGSLILWGVFSTGIQPSAVSGHIDGSVPVTSVTTNASSAAALRSDGSVITWGNVIYGGDSSSVTGDINGTTPVIKLFSNEHAFAALRMGSVITWGESGYGGDSTSVSTQLADSANPVTQIARTSHAFAALRQNGSVIIWGDPSAGGSLGGLSASLIDGTTPVNSIFSNQFSFAAIRNNGSLVTWGDVSFGGDSSSVAGKLTGAPNKVVSVRSNPYGYAALLDSGELVTWGNISYGGDSSSVNP